MNKIKVKLDNRVLMVPADTKEKYLALGYEIYSEDGKLIEKPQSAGDKELKAENEKLKAENESLKEAPQTSGSDADGEAEKGAKTTPKKTAKSDKA